MEAGTAHIGRPHRRPQPSRRQPIHLHPEHRALLVRWQGRGRQVLEVRERTRTLTAFVEELAEKDLRANVLRLDPKSGLGLCHRLVELSLLARQHGESEKDPREAPLLHVIERRDHGKRALVGADGLVARTQTQAALRFV